MREHSINKQDNLQRSQQANSQSVTLNLPVQQCQGSALSVFITDKKGRPVSGEAVCLFWAGNQVEESLCNDKGNVIFEGLPCGYFTLKVRNVFIRNVKIIGSQRKEIYVVL